MQTVVFFIKFSFNNFLFSKLRKIINWTAQLHTVKKQSRLDVRKFSFSQDHQC